MADRVDKQTRRRIMAANCAKNTTSEIEVRKALFRQGFRYRLHVRELPGSPDIVMPSKRAAIFLHGCFWHGHECQRKPRAKSNKRFWQDKIERNRKRDMKSRKELLNGGWRVLVVWECAIRRRSPPFAESDDLTNVVAWLKGQSRLAILSESGFNEYL